MSGKAKGSEDRSQKEDSAPLKEEKERELRSFGRRHGRRLRDRQAALVAETLPKLRLDLTNCAPAPLTDLFATPKRKIWLEIGFGGGEHLLSQAGANPDIGIIGCEPFIDGVAKVLSGIETDGLDNVRLYTDDARAGFTSRRRQCCRACRRGGENVPRCSLAAQFDGQYHCGFSIMRSDALY